jgi:hypothetical protein
MLCLTYGVRVFDDYALPANYGYGGGDASQLADLARSDVPAGTQSYGGVVVTEAPQATAPERPKMRIVPNPGEERQYAQPQAPVAQTQYAGTQTPAELAASTAATRPRVSPQSPMNDIKSLQQAMVAKGLKIGTTTNVPDGIWGPTTSQSLRNYQNLFGLQQVDVADGATWAVLLAPRNEETAALSAFNSRNRGANIASGLTAFADGILTAIKPPAPNATFQPSTVSGNTNTPPPSGSGWQTYALVAGGILLLGGVVYLATRSND